MRAHAAAAYTETTPFFAGWRNGEMPAVAGGVGLGVDELLGGGHVTASTALDGYLRYLEATTNTNSPFLKLHQAVATLEDRPESSFVRLFAAHLSLG
jgi:hypothetical protein